MLSPTTIGLLLPMQTISTMRGMSTSATATRATTLSTTNLMSVVSVRDRQYLLLRMREYFGIARQVGVTLVVTPNDQTDNQQRATTRDRPYLKRILTYPLLNGNTYTQSHILHNTLFIFLFLLYFTKKHKAQL